MKLMTKAIARQLPKLYATQNTPEPEKLVVVKFFTPWSNWTWYAVEGVEVDGSFEFFGYVKGLEAEWGYFNLAELESIRGPFGLKVERDLHFKPTKFADIRGVT